MTWAGLSCSRTLRMSLTDRPENPIRYEMSLEKLSGLYYMKKLIGRDAQRIEDLRARLTSTTTNMNGMPGSPNASDKIGDGIPEIVDLIRKIEEERLNFEIEKASLEIYLRRIEDPQIRLIFLLRFVDLKSWGDVASAIGGNNTDNSVKKTCYRYLKKSGDETCPTRPNEIE